MEGIHDLAGADLTAIFGLPVEQSWQERALCSQTDPEAFFPERRFDPGGETDLCRLRGA